MARAHCRPLQGSTASNIHIFNCRNPRNVTASSTPTEDRQSYLTLFVDLPRRGPARATFGSPVIVSPTTKFKLDPHTPIGNFECRVALFDGMDEDLSQRGTCGTQERSILFPAPPPRPDGKTNRLRAPLHSPQQLQVLPYILIFLGDVLLR
jgi:hypothetical protein